MTAIDIFPTTTKTVLSPSVPLAASAARPMIAELDDSVAVNLLRYAIGLSAVLSNAFLVALVLRSKPLRQLQYNCYIAVLALADCAIGLGICVRASYALYASNVLHTTHFSKVTCVLVNTTQTIGFNITYWALLAIAYDRLRAIASPLSYRCAASKRRLLTLALLTVVFTAVTLFTNFFHIDTENPTAVCSMGPSTGPYNIYFNTAYQTAVTALLIGLYVPCLVLFYRKGKQSTAVENTIQKAQKRVTVCIMIQIATHACLWTIPIAVILVTKWLPTGTTVAGDITWGIGFATGVNSALALPVYFWKHRELREHASEFLCGSSSRINCCCFPPLFQLNNSQQQNSEGRTPPNQQPTPLFQRCAKAGMISGSNRLYLFTTTKN